MNENIVGAALQATDDDLYWQVGGSSFVNAVAKRGARVRRYRRYERGDHDCNLTDEQKKLLNLKSDTSGLNEANSNYCAIVVDMMAGRLSVSEINSQDEATEEWVQDVLTRNNFESLQGEWFRGAIRDTESFVLIDPQTGLWSSEPAFDGYSGMVAIYDSMTNLPVWACKLWTVAEKADVTSDDADLGADDSEVVHVVVYQPNQISFWKARDGNTEIDPEPMKPEDVQTGEGIAMLEGGNGFTWPLGLLPLGQFANKRDNYTSYGESEIRAVLPLQDITNATLYDMMMASKLSAFKIYWSKGMKIEKDGIMPGSIINLVLTDKNGNTVTSYNEAMARFVAAAEVGEFGTTDMSQYTNQLDKLEREISQVSATPIYGITNQSALSGEALKQLEMGLINKVIRFQKENTGVIKTLIKLTALIQLTFDVQTSFSSRVSKEVSDFLDVKAPVDPPTDIGDLNVNWRSPEIVNTSEQITALSNIRRDNPGLWPDEWYREKMGNLLGMTSQDIKEKGEAAELQKTTTIDSLLGGRSGNEPNSALEGGTVETTEPTQNTQETQA